MVLRKPFSCKINVITFYAPQTLLYGFIKLLLTWGELLIWWGFHGVEYIAGETKSQVLIVTQRNRGKWQSLEDSLLILFALSPHSNRTYFLARFISLARMCVTSIHDIISYFLSTYLPVPLWYISFIIVCTIWQAICWDIITLLSVWFSSSLITH